MLAPVTRGEVPPPASSREGASWSRTGPPEVDVATDYHGFSRTEQTLCDLIIRVHPCQSVACPSVPGGGSVGWRAARRLGSSLPGLETRLGGSSRSRIRARTCAGLSASRNGRTALLHQPDREGSRRRSWGAFSIPFPCRSLRAACRPQAVAPKSLRRDGAVLYPWAATSRFVVAMRDSQPEV